MSTTAPTPARVLIADDHALAREGLRAMLERAGGLVIVGEAASGEEAVRIATEQRPDLALLDIRYAGGTIDGLEAARRITAAAPTVRLVMFTLHDEPAYVRAALAAGARGYVTKDASRDDLLAALRQVLAGGHAVPPSLLQRALTATAPDPTKQLERLTPREREVLDALADGRTNKEIATALGITPGTVKAHVERVIAKLGVRDRTQAAVLAVEARR